MEYENLLYNVSDHIARITFNRPEKRNSLSVALRREIIAALHAAEADDDVTVILIEGAGSSFCAGYDLGSGAGGYADNRPDGWLTSEHYDNWTDQLARSIFRDWIQIWDLMKPVVAKVHCYCLAGGSEVMSMCDIVFVADDAVLGYPPMRIMATADLPYFPWKMSMARAKYLQLTGHTVTGKQAAEWGWVVKSFPPEELDEQVMREIRPIAQMSPALLAANKMSLNQAYEIMGMRQALQDAWKMHQLSCYTRADAGEFGKVAKEHGIKAALERMNGPFLREGFPF
jgi:enoyl-CoA hydratase